VRNKESMFLPLRGVLVPKKTAQSKNTSYNANFLLGE